MNICALCNNYPEYWYKVGPSSTIKYCKSHLPRFLYPLRGTEALKPVESENIVVIVDEVVEPPKKSKKKEEPVVEAPVVEEVPTIEEPIVEDIEDAIN